MHILHPKFATDKIAISINQTGLSQTDGLDFCTRKYNTSCIRIDKFVIERCSFILYIYLCSFLQFNIKDYLLNIIEISSGEATIPSAATKAKRVNCFSSTSNNKRAPS